MYDSLNEFLRTLEAQGELLRVSAYVDPLEEIAEITERIVRSGAGSKALLFENTGTRFPVVTNLFGSEKRMGLALGVTDINDIPARIEALASRTAVPPDKFSDKLHTLSIVGKAAGWLPKKVRGRGSCQQIVKAGNDVDLHMLPVLKCREHDGGRFVTLPIVNTVDPDTKVRNAGMYRIQIFDRNTAAVHWHIHKTGARHYESYRSRNERMPVSVCLGGDPAYTYAATAPLPDRVDEYLFAGFLRGKAVKLVKCLTNELWIPADCDFVIEGYVDPSEAKVVEGPFGDHTGFYSLEDLYPLLHVTAITHRADAVWPATIVGIPPQEDYYIAQATERIFLAPIKLALQPEIEDIYLPSYGTAHNLALVSIRRSYPGQAHKVASALWGTGQMMFNKFMIIADAGTNLRDPEVIARLVRNADPRRALIRGAGVLDVLDHSTATPGFGGKLALDLTGVAATPTDSPGLPPLATSDPAPRPPSDARLEMSYARRWGVALLFAGAQADITFQAIHEQLGGVEPSVHYVVIFDREAFGLNAGELLWLACANIDPSRDTCIVGERLFADARTKYPVLPGNPRRFPNPTVSSRRIVSLVDRRWQEYGLGEFVPSFSERYRRLVRSDKAEI